VFNIGQNVKSGFGISKCADVLCSWLSILKLVCLCVGSKKCGTPFNWVN